MKIGIVLEGGGMRGIYSAGVLQAFLDKHFMADEVVGVSAGASIGISYVSMQSERGLRTTVDYAEDKRYLSIDNFLKTKSFFGMDYIFGDIPEKLDPFDYEAFRRNPCAFYAGVTDVHTGKTVYFGKEDITPPCTVLRASCSLPVCSPIVHYKGGGYLDGGLHAPIPIEKALADHCDHIIVILTRERGYRKSPQIGRPIYASAFRRYPAMIHILDTRYRIYNTMLKTISRMEKQGSVIIAAPERPLPLDRFGTNRQQLTNAYRIGLKIGTETLARAQKEWGLKLPRWSVKRRTVTVTVDRPLGSVHPNHPDMIYPVNYGYIKGIPAGDGEDQDAYILGVNQAVEQFTGEVAAVLHRKDDVEDKWVVVPEGSSWTAEEIKKQVAFTEKYFDTKIEMK